MDNVEAVTPVVKVKRKYTRKTLSKPLGRPKKATVVAGEGGHSYRSIKAILAPILELPLPDAVVLSILRAYVKL